MKIALIVCVFLAGVTALAKNICFASDFADAIKIAGGPAKVKHIDMEFDLTSLTNMGVRGLDKDMGSKTFGVVFDGSKLPIKTVCIQISGQAYQENTCQICAVLW